MPNRESRSHNKSMTLPYELVIYHTRYRLMKTKNQLHNVSSFLALRLNMKKNKKNKKKS